MGIPTSRCVLCIMFANDWLKRTVSRLEGLWDGATLTEAEAKDLLKGPKVLVLISGTAETDALRRWLGVQNLSFKTTDWGMISRKVEKEGIVLVFSIGFLR